MVDGIEGVGIGMGMGMSVGRVARREVWGVVRRQVRKGVRWGWWVLLREWRVSIIRRVSVVLALSWGVSA